MIIKASLPGLKSDDVQFNVSGEMRAIKSETKEKAEFEDKACHIRKQGHGVFERKLSVPTMVMPDKAKAEFDAGVLIITLPKAEEVKPETITVKARRAVVSEGRSRAGRLSI